MKAIFEKLGMILLLICLALFIVKPMGLLAVLLGVTFLLGVLLYLGGRKIYYKITGKTNPEEEED